jgi:hypothetical protein
VDFYLNDSNRNYLEPKSKRNVIPFLPAITKEKLESDMQVDPRGGNRPRTPFFSSLAKEYRSELENYFQKFCEQQAAEQNLGSAEAFATMSQTELLVLLGDTFNPKDFDFDEDKVRLNLLLIIFY